jgi:hypothetical protein
MSSLALISLDAMREHRASVVRIMPGSTEYRYLLVPGRLKVIPGCRK